MIESADIPQVRILKERRVKARLNFLCDCCNCAIKHGDTHTYIVYLDEYHSFRAVRLHIHCPET